MLKRITLIGRLAPISSENFQTLIVVFWKNIRLFYLNNGIKKLDNFQVDNIIQQSVSEVLYSVLHEPFVNMHPGSYKQPSCIAPTCQSS